MKATEEMATKFKKVKQRGDLQELMKICGVSDVSNMSNIVHGKRHTTISVLSKVAKFLNKREKQIAQLTETE